jgi:hypothetical protein
MKRRAVLKNLGNSWRKTVEAYLPSNYKVIGEGETGELIIEGEDYAGWTLDGYVIPRLASGLIWATEIK